MPSISHIIRSLKSSGFTVLHHTSSGLVVFSLPSFSDCRPVPLYLLPAQVSLSNGVISLHPQPSQPPISASYFGCYFNLGSDTYIACCVHPSQQYFIPPYGSFQSDIISHVDFGESSSHWGILDSHTIISSVWPHLNTNTWDFNTASQHLFNLNISGNPVGIATVFHISGLQSLYRTLITVL